MPGLALFPGPAQLSVTSGIEAMPGLVVFKWSKGYAMLPPSIAHHSSELKHMWQSRIEIEYYSVACFKRITELTHYSAELPLRMELIHAM